LNCVASGVSVASDLTVCSTTIVYVVERSSEVCTASVTLFVALLYAGEIGTWLKSGRSSLTLETVIVDESIGSVNVTVGQALVATFVALVAGVYALTVGAGEPLWIVQLYWAGVASVLPAPSLAFA